MILVVADPALLDWVKTGDRVKFKAGLVAGRFAVIEIARLKTVFGPGLANPKPLTR